MKNIIYVIEYRFWDKDTNQWITKISQEAYSKYEDAKKFCEERAMNAGATSVPRYFQNRTSNGVHEEYYIHDVTVV